MSKKLDTPHHPYGLPNADALKELEELHVATRINELHGNPIRGTFDYDHMKAIHHYLFQDVYEWAGQERTAPDTFMNKDGHEYFAAGPYLTVAANQQYDKIRETNYLRDMEQDAFIHELAEIGGELNVVHSFREGNTRTQAVFFYQLCEQAGYNLDVAALGNNGSLQQAFIQARFHSQNTGSNQQLENVLKRAVSKTQQDITRDDILSRLRKRISQAQSSTRTNTDKPPRRSL